MENNVHPTFDPYVFIVESGIDSFGTKYIIYCLPYQNEQWIVLGECNCCGLCDIGSNNPNQKWVEGKQPGEPYSSYYIDHSLDTPMRPEGLQKLRPICTLSGNYLNGIY